MKELKEDVIVGTNGKEITAANLSNWPKDLLDGYFGSKEFDDTKSQVQALYKTAAEDKEEQGRLIKEINELESKVTSLIAELNGINAKINDFEQHRIEKEEAIMIAARKAFLERNHIGSDIMTTADVKDPDDWYNMNWDIDSGTKGTAEYDAKYKEVSDKIDAEKELDRIFATDASLKELADSIVKDEDK